MMQNNDKKPTDACVSGLNLEWINTNLYILIYNQFIVFENDVFNSWFQVDSSLH